ncbi:MAG: Histidyl-tRNA synthetase [Parcubacteria group bacterium GW2011_GWC2_38_7]|nr:MAG: Histidyl-tRNA synthetase [Parcubacteria group bacterium GW2011_GWC2_38_7]
MSRRVSPILPAGFRDLGSEDMILKRHILSIVQQVFERYGFEPFSSSGVQFLDVLFGKDHETEMSFFQLWNTRHDLKAGNAELALKFDQTVPLGRYVAANYEALPKPYARYEIGEAFRGESPGEGRYCGFTQCDADLVFAPGMISDAQIITLMDECMRALGVSTHKILLNNRKILGCLPGYIGFAKRYLRDVLTIIDKRGRFLPGETLTSELAKLTTESGQKLLSAKKIEKLVDFCIISGSASERFESIRVLMVQTDELDQGIKELEEVLRYLKLFGVDEDRVQFDQAMVRGLGYYTGPIFEVILTDSPETGSVFGGGRYDDLVLRFVRMPAPATGAAFGIDRFLVYAKKRGLFDLPKSVVKVLVGYRPAPECLARAIEVTRMLREQGINTLLYDGPDKAVRGQLGRADKSGIPVVVIIGESEVSSGLLQVKRMSNKEERSFPMQLRNLVTFIRTGIKP